MYNLTRDKSPSHEVAVGTDFWNLNHTPVSPGTCDIGSQFPLTWATVQDNG